MRPESELTKRVALLCTFSNVILSFLYIGAQTEVAYSKCGRTRDLYRFRNMALSRYVKLQNMSATKTLSLPCFSIINNNVTFNALMFGHGYLLVKSGLK